MKALYTFLARICCVALLYCASFAQGTWHVQSIRTDESFYAVAFTSRWNGWVVGTVSYPAYVYHTTDGGRTWVPIEVPFVGTFSTVFFSDSLTGWAAGSAAGTGQSYLVSTTNGGQG